MKFSVSTIKWFGYYKRIFVYKTMELMRHMFRLAVAILLAFAAGVQAQLVTYPEGLATGMPHNDDYTVRVRVPGGEWKDLFEYNVQVDMDKVQNASMVQFDMGSPVEVMVKKNNETVREAAIRPLNNNVAYKQLQNTVFFTLDKPQYLSVEFNGDRLHNLHLLPTRWRRRSMDRKKKVLCILVPVCIAPRICPTIRFVYQAIPPFT